MSQKERTTSSAQAATCTTVKELTTSAAFQKPGEDTRRAKAQLITKDAKVANPKTSAAAFPARVLRACISCVVMENPSCQRKNASRALMNRGLSQLQSL